jgi:hypothetical protein
MKLSEYKILHHILISFSLLSVNHEDSHTNFPDVEMLRFHTRFLSLFLNCNRIEVFIKVVEEGLRYPEMKIVFLLIH